MRDRWPTDPVARAAAVAAWGLASRDADALASVLRLASDDPDPRVRAAAVGALARRGAPAAAVGAWRSALADADPAVRARACELAPAVLAGAADDAQLLVDALADPAELVAEAAAFGLGELGEHPVAAAAVPALIRTATGHPDALVREAAVAALGSLGDPAGLPAVLTACSDKPAVRRRAVLALAAFEGPEVEAALQRALGDRDWQVRQAAEDLLN